MLLLKGYAGHARLSNPPAPAEFIPAHKPIKPIYIMKFIDLLDALGASDVD